MNEQSLERENLRYRGTGGVSAENRGLGFRPAFLDRHTGTVHPARFADGRLASFHSMDGLPADVVLARRESGSVAAVKPSIMSGFERGGRFYTREQAARIAALAAEPA